MRGGRIWIWIGLSLLASAAVVVHTIAASDGWQRMQHLQAELSSVKQQNEALRERARKMHQRINGLRERPDVQARAIRDELGYVGPNELIVDVGASNQKLAEPSGSGKSTPAVPRSSPD
jgi:cell division protein FtsB